MFRRVASKLWICTTGQLSRQQSTRAFTTFGSGWFKQLFAGDTEVKVKFSFNVPSAIFHVEYMTFLHPPLLFYSRAVLLNNPWFIFLMLLLFECGLHPSLKIMRQVCFSNIFSLIDRQKLLLYIFIQFKLVFFKNYLVFAEPPLRYIFSQ